MSCVTPKACDVNQLVVLGCLAFVGSDGIHTGSNGQAAHSSENDTEEDCGEWVVHVERWVKGWWPVKPAWFAPVTSH